MGVIREALREFVGDGDGEDEKVLARHNRAVERKALHDAAEAFDLDDLASVQWIAEGDHYLSVSIRTNQDAREFVQKWLHERADAIEVEQ